MGDTMADLQGVLDVIDAANARDPNRIEVDGVPQPAALLYGQRMSATLGDYEPAAGTELRIAARGQHIERWTVPRVSYPEGRIGYLTWRKELQRFHARRLAEIMTAADFDATACDRVGQIVRKERLALDPEVQTLEDVACLVFLEYELAGFSATQDDGKLASILAKTWGKMSAKAHDNVLASPPPQRILDLLATGLAAIKEGRP
jgi:hypothetical protein